jgi:hypothetical protein
MRYAAAVELLRQPHADFLTRRIEFFALVMVFYIAQKIVF